MRRERTGKGHVLREVASRDVVQFMRYRKCCKLLLSEALSSSAVNSSEG